MKKISFIFALLMIFSSPVWAQRPINYDVKGAGASSCGTWTLDHAQGDVSAAANVDDEWVLGFVVGQELLYADTTHKNYTISTDYNGIIGWIGNYCQQNPVKEIVDAAQNFVLKSNAVSPVDY
jgi:hypothetical protein